MVIVSVGSPLAQALIEQGLVPKECGDIVLEMPVDGLVKLKYEVWVTNVDLLKLSRAFQRAHDLMNPEE